MTTGETSMKAQNINIFALHKETLALEAAIIKLKRKEAALAHQAGINRLLIAILTTPQRK